MRMLLILLMAAALAAGGFLTRPDEAAHRANADKVLGERRGGFDVGDLIDDVLGSALNERKFEDMFVATRYTVNSGGAPMLECLGLFGQFMCSQPGAK